MSTQPVDAPGPVLVGRKLPPPEPPSIPQLVKDLARQFSLYARDLSLLFRAEMKENTRAVAAIAAFVGLGVLTLLASFVFLSWALVAGIAFLLKAWGWALLIVGVFYGLVGASFLVLASRAARRTTLQFPRTKERLRQDQAFIKDKVAS